MIPPTVFHNGWIQIAITAEMAENAQQHARRMAERMGDTPLESTNYWAKGSGPGQHFQDLIDGLGSEALRFFLTWAEVPYTEYQGNPEHFEGDEYDFLIQDLKWDLKTAHAPTNMMTQLPAHYGMLISMHQIDKPMDGYIHIQIDKGLHNAYLIGYIGHAMAKTFTPREDAKMKSPAVLIPFRELHQPAGLFDPNPLWMEVTT